MRGNDVLSPAVESCATNWFRPVASPPVPSVRPPIKSSVQNSFPLIRSGVSNRAQGHPLSRAFQRESNSEKCSFPDRASIMYGPALPFLSVWSVAFPTFNCCAESDHRVGSVHGTVPLLFDAMTINYKYIVETSSKRIVTLPSFGSID